MRTFRTAAYIVFLSLVLVVGISYAVQPATAYAVTGPLGNSGSGGNPGGNPQVNGSGGTQTNSTGISGINLFYLDQYSQGIIGTINFYIIPVLLSIAFLMFLWGVYKYFILGAAESESRKEGRGFILWSIIGFVVIFAVWGLVALVGSTFGLSGGGTAPPYPTL